MRPFTPAVLLAFLLVSAPPLLSAQNIDTRSGGPGTGGEFGHSRHPGGTLHVAHYWGQTFSVTPGWTELTSFAFWLRGYHPDYATGVCCKASDIHFSAYLMAWNPARNRAEGEILWKSERQAGPGAGPTPVRYGFETGGVALDPSSMYLAFLSTDNDILVPLPYTDSEFPTRFAHVAGTRDVYSGGRAVYATGAVNPALGNGAAHFRARSWQVPFPSDPIDAQFTADFAPAQTTVPEPASMALLGSGLAGLAGWRRRRRKQQ